MKRSRGLVAIGPLLAALGGAPAEALLPLVESCRAVALEDADGRSVVGVEDLALDGAVGRLLLSAYDRRSGTEGGLYAWPLGELDAATPKLERLEVEGLPPGGFRPHGLAHADGRIAVVNRTDGGPVVDRFTVAENRLRHVGRFADARLCGPNDVALRGAEVLVTNDRGACGGLALWLERVLNRPAAFVMALDGGEGRAVAAGLRFANGIAVRGSELLVAETRAFSVRDLASGAAIGLPFAPDNLVVGEDGAVWAAGPRRLWRLALFMAGWSATAGPSLVARLGDGEARVWRLPDGLVEGATAALAVRGRLVIAAGWDERVAVCADPLSRGR